MKLDKKSRFLIGLLYGFITAVANGIGALFPNFLKMPVMNSFYTDVWVLYINEHPEFDMFVTTGSFIIPSLLCVIYGITKNPKKIDYRFINLPFAFSVCGISGWAFYFVYEVISMIIIKSSYHMSILPVILASLMYTSLQMMMSFSLAFFTMETLHRRVILPKYYAEGHLERFEKVKGKSLKFIFVVFYITALIFPLIYVSMVYLTTVVNNGLLVEKTCVIVFSILVVVSVAITFVLYDYFENPLKKLQEATKKIEKGNYDERVGIVTTDSFGILADSFNDMTDSLKAKNKKILSIQNSIVTGMATMVESRDNSTGGHIKRTSDCVKIFIEELKKSSDFDFMTPSFCESMIKAAPMHDLGKIAVDDAILRKPGKFTDEEYEIMKSHSAAGAKIVANVLQEVDDLEFKQIAVNVAHYHHEKYDGKGYPCGLKGEEIPFEARIMALADVFDALVSKRCYKDSFSYDKAFQIIEESLGTHFDPLLGKAFIACRENLESLYNNGDE